MLHMLPIGLHMTFGLLLTLHWSDNDGQSRCLPIPRYIWCQREAATALQVVQLIDCGDLHWRGQQLMGNVTLVLARVRLHL